MSPPHRTEKCQVLILSQGSGETTTNIVMEYLIGMGLWPLRINGQDFGSHGRFSISLEAGHIRVDNSAFILDFQQVKVVWFRRWLESQKFEGVNLVAETSSESHATSQRIAKHLRGELSRVSSLLFSELKEAYWLGNPHNASLNKLQVLALATRLGLETPATLVTTNKKELQHFASRHSVITKPIGEVDLFEAGGAAHLMYTQELSDDLINSLPEVFFPSLFQEKIEKNFDVRVFFLDGACYSAAIFSQVNDNTKTDFRKYDRKRPNRVVPYGLPLKIEESIRCLMRELDLVTGSLDLIKAPDGRMVFLEVNPVGQFGMISVSCNYHLERKLAEFLAQKVNHGKS